VNTLRITRDALAARLRDEEMAGTRPTALAPEGLMVERGAVGRWTAFTEGWCTIQDEASMLVARLLDPQPGEVVADTCAAPGTKATHMAELMRNRGRIVAMDPQAARLKLVGRAITRLGINIIEPHVGSAAAQVLGAFLGLGAAAVLGYLIYRGGIRLDLRTFFRVTGLLLLVVAAGLFAFSVHELQEVGWLPFLDGQAFDISGTLSDQSGFGAILRALIGYQDAPTVLELGAGIAYLVVTGALFLRGPAPTPTRAVAASDAPSVGAGG